MRLFIDSIVPILICLLIERGLSLNIIREGAGMFVHIINVIVLVLIPMVIIHVNGDSFSLSKYKKDVYCRIQILSPANINVIIPKFQLEP